MITYSLIIKNTIKTYNNIFFSSYKNDLVDGVQKIMFSVLLNKEISTKNKFLFFKESLEGILIKNTRESEFIDYFCKIQKIYNILNKFVYNYKYKKAKTVVNADLCLNELNIQDKNVMCIFHNNSKYLFHINDLIKMINVALTHSYMFFSDPKCIKNPYDNIPFNKSTLYNIYFFIKYKTDYHPELFFKFFAADFNLTLFKNNNECLLRDHIIKNYVYTSPSNLLINEINTMIYYHNESYIDENITIDDEFPREKLIKIMRPYLLLYFTSQYSYLKHIKRESAYILKRKLLMFHKFNPYFGRKKYKILTKYDANFKKQICGKLIEFDDKHIKFNNIEERDDAFLSDHLKYDETNVISSIFPFSLSPAYRLTGTYLRSVSSREASEDEEDDEEDDISAAHINNEYINEADYYEDNSDTESIS